MVSIPILWTRASHIPEFVLQTKPLLALPFLPFSSPRPDRYYLY